MTALQKHTRSGTKELARDPSIFLIIISVWAQCVSDERSFHRVSGQPRKLLNVDPQELLMAGPGRKGADVMILQAGEMARTEGRSPEAIAVIHPWFRSMYSVINQEENNAAA